MRLLLTLGILAVPSLVLAQHCPNCPAPAVRTVPQVEYQLVPRVTYKTVPRTVTETVPRVTYEQVERTVYDKVPHTVYDKVPVVREVPQAHCPHCPPVTPHYAPPAPAALSYPQPGIGSFGDDRVRVDYGPLGRVRRIELQGDPARRRDIELPCTAPRPRLFDGGRRGSIGIRD